MQVISALARKEVRSYFHSPIAYIYLLVFLVFTALMYMVLTKIPDFAAQLGGGLALSAAALSGFISSQIARRAGISTRV